MQPTTSLLPRWPDHSMCQRAPLDGVSGKDTSGFSIFAQPIGVDKLLCQTATVQVGSTVTVHILQEIFQKKYTRSAVKWLM